MAMGESNNGKWINRIVCKIRGHEWRKRPVCLVDPDEVVGVCERCGEEATMLEAASIRMHGGGPPVELLEQDDIDMMKAKYRDGEINRERMELGIGAALGDEEALEEIEQLMEEETQE